jgi:hypothetical protein
MKKAEIKIDRVEDTAKIFGQKVKSMTTNSGHYCVPLLKAEEENLDWVLSVNMVESVELWKAEQKQEMEFKESKENKEVEVESLIEGEDFFSRDPLYVRLAILIKGIDVG